ncbi:MAG: tetratricopeptide repeat protein [Magnetococcales bacterium]|nr:tetratricopeptide repeat protein [Magnetococcales bacterium]
MKEEKSSNNGQTQLTVDAAYAQAIDHFNAERYTESDKLCTAIIQVVPVHIDAINLLGVIAQKLDRYDLAVDQFQKAINIDNNRALLYYNLGASYYQLGRIEEAIKALNTALEREPGNSQIINFLNGIISKQCPDIGISNQQYIEQTTKFSFDGKETNLYAILSYSRSNNVDAYLILDAAFKQDVLMAKEKSLLCGFVGFVKGKSKLIKSQLYQDVFAAYIIGDNFKKTFLEFGATDGVSLSNTYLLDMHMGWDGILCEPSPQWHSGLKNNRAKTKILTDCIWTKTGETLDFFMSDVGVLSTLDSFKYSDINSMPGNASARNKVGKKIKVKTISLNDVVSQYYEGVAPSYISVDTEGSEFDIISSFDFTNYRPIVWTVEHNFTTHQKKIDEIMLKNGYKRVFENITSFDAWYVDQEHYNYLNLPKDLP